MIETILKKIFPLIAAVASASADGSECQNHGNNTDLIKFGKFSPGDPVTSNLSELKWIESEECYISKSYYDCDFYDENNMHYIIEGMEVIKVFAGKDNIAELPLGIMIGDNLENFLKKIPNDFPSMSLGWNTDNKLVLETDFLFPSQSGECYSLYIIFDNTFSLEEIGKKFNYP